MPLKDIPYNDPGSLGGGVRQHLANLKNVQADAFRSASQNQQTGQAARAFSGANVSNIQTVNATIQQDEAEAENRKTFTIEAVAGTNANAAAFDFNYMQRYVAGAEAADFLSRGAANMAQDQGVDQSAFAKLFEDFDGLASVANNSITQGARVDQSLDVELIAVVTNTTRADNTGHAFNQSRLREISANVEDQSAQAIFTSGQRQGSAANAQSQIAVADGGNSDNFLNQTGFLDQTSNRLDLDGTFNLAVNETAALGPRTTELHTKVDNNSAVTSSAASQEQSMSQSGAGGVEEAGNVTENGGDAQNSSTNTLTNQESTDSQNSISIQI